MSFVSRSLHAPLKMSVVWSMFLQTLPAGITVINGRTGAFEKILSPGCEEQSR